MAASLFVPSVVTKTMKIQTKQTEYGIETYRIPENDQEHRAEIEADLTSLVQEAKMAFGPARTCEIVMQAMDQEGDLDLDRGIGETEIMPEGEGDPNELDKGWQKTAEDDVK